MPESRVIRGEEIEHFQRAPGVTVSGHITTKFGATEIFSGITSFDTGCSNITHYHNAEESVMVIGGEGNLIINGEENRVRANDAALITPGAPPPPDQHRRIPLPRGR